MQKRKLFHAVACAVAITLMGCGAGSSVTRSAPVHHKTRVFAKAKPRSERATRIPKTKPEKSAPQKTEAKHEKAAPDKKTKTESDAAHEEKQERDNNNANTRNDLGETELMWAAFYGDESKVKVLISNGAEIDAKNNKGGTALSYAVSGGQERIARFLIAKGADVNAKNKFGGTPLMYACAYGHEKIAKLLIAKGADVNVNSPVVGTALILASANMRSYEKQENIVRLLIKSGAEINAKGVYFFDKDKKAKTALTVAAENNEKKIAQILKKHGAK